MAAENVKVCKSEDIVEIVLDSREAHLKQELVKNEVNHVIEQLAVGDILFRLKNKDGTVGKILFICERKTTSDLYSSIVSSRFREQRERLKSTGVKVCFLIENYKDVSSQFNKNSTNVVSGALQNLVLFHNIHILPTFSAKHSAKVMVDIRKKIQEAIDSGKEIGGGETDKVSDSMAVVAMTQKKDKLMEHIHEHQLMLIPGVSTNVAKAISILYPTVRKLVDAYDKAETMKEKHELLSNIQLGKRKLGKILSKRIYEIYN